MNRLPVVVVAGLALACSDATPPKSLSARPAAISLTSSPPASVTVGASAGAIAVKVVDSSGAVVPGAAVAFTVSRGSGDLSRALDTTLADGTATATFRAGTAPGRNDISVLVSGVPPLVVTITGVAGQPRSVRISPRSLRFRPTEDSLVITATARDTFNNITTVGTTWAAKDTNMLRLGITLAGNLAVKVKARPGSTWIVATSGVAVDSIPVAVTDSSTGSAPCLLGPTAVDLAVGATLQFDGGVACVRASSTGAEYAVIAHLNTAASNVSQAVEVTGEGISTAPMTFPLRAPGTALVARTDADVAFERRLRQREADEIGPWTQGARAWLRARASVIAPVDAPTRHAVPSTATVGNLVALNVNSAEFCDNPSIRNGRVAAVTSSAIIMSDLENPTGEFTDDEYRQIGEAMDTLVNPIDTAAFGAPTDIDGNKRIGIFFTKAVNELTPQGSPSGVVLGFYYLRDLLPRASDFGDCPGSNVGEMFYILVPDPNGVVNKNARTKAFVRNIVLATLAHEYQHLINASRRMYITNAPRVDEETWLNEGLSHIAEELLFYRGAATTPRQNIDGSQLALGTPAREAFDQHQRSNLIRYREFLRAPESTSPLAADDRLATRGATWSFLRYLVDRTRPADGDFWRRLVNSSSTGVVNLDSVLAGTGLTTLSAMRDWSVSVLADDNISALDGSLQQKSWNAVSTLLTAGGGLTYALAPRILSNGVGQGAGLLGGGSGYFRLGIPQGQDALIRAAAFAGAPLPNGTKLTIIRIK